MDELQKTLQILQIMKTLFSPPNPWIPVYAAIGGAITGAITAILPHFLLELRKEKKAVFTLTASIVSEITATLATIQVRDYEKHFNEAIQQLKDDPKQRLALEIPSPHNFSKVFDANINNVGLIDVRIRDKVVIFYNTLEYVVRDVIPGGRFSQGVTLQDYEIMVLVLKQALKIGQSIQDDWRIYNRRHYDKVATNNWQLDF